MNSKILKALESSICKWNDICMGNGMDKGVVDCALCELFHFYDCQSCIVANFSGEICCRNTPYRAWDKAWDDLNGNDLNKYGTFRLKHCVSISELPESLYKTSIINSAEAELIFLLELLPEGHAWREMI